VALASAYDERVSDASTERIKANNATFREANERISSRAQELGAALERIPFICECPVEDCVEIVHLTPAQYGEVRKNPSWYMTAEGHEAADAPVAEVVVRNDGYVVVEKRQDG
jgi:hypothetical protein